MARAAFILMVTHCFVTSIAFSLLAFKRRSGKQESFGVGFQRRVCVAYITINVDKESSLPQALSPTDFLSIPPRMSFALAPCFVSSLTTRRIDHEMFSKREKKKIINTTKLLVTNFVSYFKSINLPDPDVIPPPPLPAQSANRNDKGTIPTPFSFFFD